MFYESSPTRTRRPYTYFRRYEYFYSRSTEVLPYTYSTQLHVHIQYTFIGIYDTPYVYSTKVQRCTTTYQMLRLSYFRKYLFPEIEYVYFRKYSRKYFRTFVLPKVLQYCTYFRNVVCSCVRRYESTFEGNRILP